MTKLAYTFEEAGQATGYSETTIKDAVRRGDIAPSYANTKPVILAAELQRWLEALPAEPRRRKKPGAVGVLPEDARTDRTS